MRRLLPLLLLAPALTACLTPEPAPKLYVLDPVAGIAAPTQTRLSLAVAPAQVPEYLDRPELIVRAGPNEVKAVDGERWAERLPVTLARGVADNLTRALGRPVPLTPSDRPGVAPDYELFLTVTRLDIDPAGRLVTLEGTWSLLDTDARKELQSAAFSQRENFSGAGLTGAVTALNRAVAAVSQSSVSAIQNLPPKR